MRDVLRNAGALVVVQVLNFALSLALLPYLAKALGVEAFGAFAYGLAVYTVSATAADMGISVMAVYRVAKREEHADISTTAYTVLAAKMLLGIVAATLASLLVFTSSLSENNLPFFLWMLAAVVTQAAQPVWFFRGVERMGRYALCSLLGRSIFFIGVLATVSDASDLTLVGFWHALSLFATALFSWWAIRRLGYGLNVVPPRVILQFIWNARGFSVSALAWTAYLGLGTVFLGSLGQTRDVAVYSIADQVYRGLKNLRDALAEALLPFMTRTRDYVALKKFMWALLSMVLVATVPVAMFIPVAVEKLFGPEFQPLVIVLWILMAAFLLDTPASLLGYPLFAAVDKLYVVNSAVVGAAITLVVCLVLVGLTQWVSSVAVAISFVVATFVLLAWLAVAGQREFARRGVSVSS